MTDKASSLQNNYHLAPINIAKMKAPLNDPIMAEFANALEEKAKLELSNLMALLTKFLRA